MRPTQQGWCKPSKGAPYSDVSLKVFRGFLKNGLRYVKLPNGRILTKYQWIDEYLEQFGVKDEAKEIAAQLTEDLT